MAACANCGKHMSCSCQLLEGKYCSDKCKQEVLNKQKEKDVKSDNKRM